MRTSTPSRNAPCPCGSGRKYKHCCIGKRFGAAPATHATRNSLILVSACALIGLGAWAWTHRTSSVDSGSYSETPGRTPEPYEYDAVNNRHWHAGHGHWHDGPPPIGLRTPEPASPATPATAPEPYEYDPVQNRHWDPDHGHWHNGPPPARDTTP